MVNVTKLFCGADQPADNLRYGHGSGAPVSASARRPIVVWNITRTCNLKCLHCYSDSYTEKYDGELTNEEAKRNLDDLAAFKVPAVLFSGGEPLVRPDLLDLIAYATGKGLRVTLSTNGTLIDDEIAAKLKALALTYVGISLDGIGETNDHFRGVPGAFDRAVRGFRACHKTVEKVGLRLTLTKHNCQDLHKDEGIPVQTIAPKFSGRFNKGVDYVGDVAQFEREFVLDVAAIAYAVKHFGLPENLKLSVHSGSDKFSIYPAIHSTIQRFNAGVHLKTAGTTWLEELIGLAEAGGDALALAKEIYAEAFAHSEELCAPYATVIDIDASKLPSPAEVRGWTSAQYTSALRHVRGAAAYNSSLRQLLHVGFKVAARMGSRYLELLEANEPVIAKNVTENLYNRHIAPVFLGRND